LTLRHNEKIICILEDGRQIELAVNRVRFWGGRFSAVMLNIVAPPEIQIIREPWSREGDPHVA
jgi:hypothetical protein